MDENGASIQHYSLSLEDRRGGPCGSNGVSKVYQTNPTICIPLVRTADPPDKAIQK